MKTKRLAILVLASILSAPLQALAAPDADCVSPLVDVKQRNAAPRWSAEPPRNPYPEGQDPFHTEERFTQGPNKGKLMNNGSQRPARVLSPEEAARYGIVADPDKYTTVANVWHRGRMWVANYPIDGVKEVYIQNAQFFPMAAHNQLRFRFKPGQEVILVPQVPEAGVGAIKLNNLIYSVEGIPAQGAAYSMKDGMQDKMTAVHRLTTVEDKAEAYIVKEGRVVPQYLLSLYPSEKRKLIENAMRTSQRIGYSQFYHTIMNHCTTSMWNLLDDTLRHRPGYRVPPHRFLSTEAHLAADFRGILVPPSMNTRPTLKDEVGDINGNTSFIVN